MIASSQIGNARIRITSPRLRGEVGLHESAIRVRGTLHESRSLREPLTPTLSPRKSGEREKRYRAQSTKNSIMAFPYVALSFLLPLPVLYGERVGVRGSLSIGTRGESPSPEIRSANSDLSPHARRG